MRWLTKVNTQDWIVISSSVPKGCRKRSNQCEGNQMKGYHSEPSSGPNPLSLHTRTQLRIHFNEKHPINLGRLDWIKYICTIWVMFKTLMRIILKLSSKEICHLNGRIFDILNGKIFDVGFCIMKGIKILAISNTC